MFIDIHNHVQRQKGAPRHGIRSFCSPEELIARFDEVDIERGVLLPILGPEFYEPQNTNEILEIAQAYPDRFTPFCNVHPQAVNNDPQSDFGPLLSYYRDQGCKGLGEVTANLSFTDPLVWNLFKHAEDIGFPIIFHAASQFGGTYGLLDEPGLPQLERTLKQFPKLKLLGHSPVFWSEIGVLETLGDRDGYPKSPVKEEGVLAKLFRRYENLYGDLSAGSGCNALSRDPDYAVEFLNEFQDRLFFGTDICAPTTPTPLVDLLLDLKANDRITEVVFNKIARENAISLLELDK